jgi:histidinol-phosphate aminotransferase
MYEITARTAGATCVFVPLKDRRIDLAQMSKKVNERTRIVFVCNPNNPTGTVLPASQFRSFLADLPDTVAVVLDEAYIEFARDPECIRGTDFLDAGRPVIFLRTFSKAYGLAGLRVGYGVLPADLAELLHRIRMPFNVNSLAQAGALAALEDRAFLEKTVDLVHRELDGLYDALAQMGVSYHPTEANFFLIDVKKSADAVFEALLRKGVIVRSMTAYGFPTCIRVNIGAPEENQRLLDALSQVL